MGGKNQLTGEDRVSNNIINAYVVREWPFPAATILTRGVLMP